MNATCNRTLGFNTTDKNATCREQVRRTQAVSPSIPEEARIFLICLYVLVFLFGVIGNSVVCYVIGKKKEFSGGDAFMLSLAVADLLSSLFVPILAVHDIFSEVKWYLGAAMCKILPAISPVTLSASSWSLVLISADRYRVIVQPMKPRLSFAVKLIGIASTWIISIGIALPYILTQEMFEHNGSSYCFTIVKIMTPEEKDFYVIAFVVMGWVLPLSIIASLYGCCIYKLKERSFKSDANKSMQRRVQQNKKVINTFIIISSLYGICTLPYSVFYATIHYLLAYKRQETDMEIIWTLNYSLFALTNINSCLNPFVYARRQPEVRQFLCTAWNKLCCRAASGNASTKARQRNYEISADGTARTQSATTHSSVSRTRACVPGTFQNKAFVSTD